MRPRAFTLLEMMVSLSICLTIMIVAVPVFQVTTRTVEAVERRLAVYEAARNMLDCIEVELRQAISNENGEIFCLKNIFFSDSDPWTPPGDGLFRQSRREAHSIHFSRWGAQPHDDYSLSDQSGGLGGGYSYPRTWTGQSKSDLYHAAIAPNTIGMTAATRKPYLDDVSLIELPIMFAGRGGGGKRALQPDGSWTSTCWNEDVRCMAPGGEINGPRGSLGGAGIMSVAIVDFACAYWDEAEGGFKYPPDNCGVYFSPLPKAVRVTITVCDVKKRGRITLSRIVHLLCGIGAGVVENPSAPDAKYLAPSAFNRAKDLRQVNSFLYTGVNNSEEGF
jgi:hypothetical protein